MKRHLRIAIDLIIAATFVALFTTRESPSHTVHSIIGLNGFIAIGASILYSARNRARFARLFTQRAVR